MMESFFANFSMRSRLFALVILVLVVGIPLSVYWYFFTKNTASLTLILPWDVSYTVELRWTLDNANLPLADQLISLGKECTGTCVFAPIAPISYALILTSTWKTQIQEDIIIPVGEDITRSYELQDDITIAPTVLSQLGSPAIASAIIANAQLKDTDYLYRLIGIDRDNIVYAERKSLSWKRELGTLSLDKFTPMWVFPDWAGDMTLDITGDYFLVPLFSDKTIVMSRTLDSKKEIPRTWVLGYVGWTEEKILTNSWVILGIDSSYGENPRYTDWLDISPSLRLWYMDASDTNKFSLSGYPPGESVLVLHDRITSKTTTIKRWVDMRFLFFLSGVPVFLDKDNNLYAIDISSLL